MVLNVTEMEAKVREATNDEPWCATDKYIAENCSAHIVRWQGSKFNVNARYSARVSNGIACIREEYE